MTISGLDKASRFAVQKPTDVFGLCTKDSGISPREAALVPELWSSKRRENEKRKENTLSSELGISSELHGDGIKWDRPFWKSFEDLIF